MLTGYTGNGRLYGFYLETEEDTGKEAGFGQYYSEFATKRFKLKGPIVGFHWKYDPNDLTAIINFGLLIGD